MRWLKYAFFVLVLLLSIASPVIAVGCGQEVWNFSVGSGGITSKSFVTNGTVYFGSYDGYEYALNATTGDMIWNTNLNNMIRGEPVVVGDVLYTGVDGDLYGPKARIYALNALNGSIIWNTLTNATYIKSTPAVANNTVYFTGVVWVFQSFWTPHMFLYAVSATDGSTKGNFPIWLGDSSNGASPIVVGDVIYTGQATGATNGTYLWGDTVSNRLSSANGIVYISDGSLTMRALNAVTGEEIWNFTGITNINGLSDVVEDTIYFSDGVSNLYALNATTGEEKWLTSNMGTLTPRAANGMVYTGGEQFMRAVNTTTGLITWNFDTTNSYNHVTDPEVGYDMVYFGTTDNSRLSDHELRAVNTLNCAIPTPEADFAVSSQTAYPLEDISFTDLSTPSPLPDVGTTWLWNFGDGNTSAVKNPTYAYYSIDLYDVSLTVCDLIGECSTKTETEYINVTLPPPPTAFFESSVTAGYAPLSVDFYEESSGFLIGASYYWDFGDGNTSTDQSPTYVYPDVGVYTVNHSATNSGGTGWYNITDDINVTEPQPPVVSFTSDVTSGDAPLSVQFIDTTTGFLISDYYWDFGDGNTSTDQNPYFTYEIVGRYSVSHSATNPYGTEWNNVTNYIAAGPLPPLPSHCTSDINSWTNCKANDIGSLIYLGVLLSTASVILYIVWMFIQARE